jgi:hypothetical protein
MNYTKLSQLLKEYDPVRVKVFENYLRSLEAAKDKSGKLVNPWFKYFGEQTAADLFKKVALDEGLFIDGENITLQFKGKVMVSYNYQAYKNKLLSVYPETLFDLQNVFSGDLFSFQKEDGRVKYNHKFGDPFKTDRKLLGAYCIIKNKRGEFIETINAEDIAKMRAVAKTQKIWEAWFNEMVLKSVIKRACKRHFKDVVTNIDALDNENVDLEKANLDWDVQKLIEAAGTLEELQGIYEEYIFDVKDEAAFLAKLGERKVEIKSAAV